MKLAKIIMVLLLGMNLVTCCSHKPEARRPVSHSGGEFMKKSIERNKKLNQSEESIIADIIKKDTAVDYVASTKGYWYTYVTKNEASTDTPDKGEIAYFDYEIKDLKGKVIYSQEELKPQKYVVDKQNIIMGLRHGLKLMKKGETVRFLFPSHMAFGYHGDEKKVGTNQPLMYTVTLNDIKVDAAAAPAAAPKTTNE
ncbi:gliding motility-associated peptidyl-prolyl isomerase GldI [Flavobacterium amniphilum]|uniref:gliding motility-associated peptidyl-prolyl isomerase GldI n=1 Tax=Flavobacterium amniphilum TaxID=1834035 RepID=UPI00202A30DB|nr:gliding motility-associated peptidyl-prolyl isomerase GldI [Flavobacterium amniphilum]MCL9807622.1 gliding motility-associated peptidyl-prolyl isomerase GldI [Flavobacterium amniphilum]